MDFSRASYVLLPSDQTAEQHGSPQNIAITAAGASAVIAAGTLVYSIGKDLVPKLKNAAPLIVQILNASPDRTGAYYQVDLRLTNSGANGLYVEEIRIVQGACEAGDIPTTGGSMGDFGDPVARDKHAEDRNEKTYGNVLPCLLASSEVRDLRIRSKSGNFYNGPVPMAFGGFSILYSDLGGTRTETSDAASFRILNLPRKDVG